jgi:hypothetical protein
VITCTCWFCEQEKPHPDHHTMEWTTFSHLTVAESLKSEDRIWYEACSPCGHKRPCAAPVR